MSKDLVYVEKGKVFCTSLDISREFDIMHLHILEKIRNLTNDIPIVSSQFIESRFINERYKKLFHSRYVGCEKLL